MADPSITKQAAAQRQIDTAIRMLFLHGEDFCATHTVAAAARSILQHLAGARGVGYMYETRRSLEELYRKQHGLDPAEDAVEDEINRKTNAIEKDKKTWNYRNKATNFLKHADKDPDDVLSLAEVNPCWVIMDAINLWGNMNLPITIDMRVYCFWWFGVTAQQPEEFVNTKEGPIHLFNFAQQIDFGRYLLMRVYRDRRRSIKGFRDDAAYRLGPVTMYRALE
jgi:hypothetical protein